MGPQDIQRALEALRDEFKRRYESAEIGTPARGLWCNALFDIEGVIFELRGEL